MMTPSPLQRLRFTFAVDGPLRYIAVLDRGRLWERLLRRAGLPLAYSQGFNPHPRVQFADALPLGYASLCERVDVFLKEPIAPEEALARARVQSPVGLTILSVEEVPPEAPALQALVRAALYRVEVWSDEPAETIQKRLESLLLAPSLPRIRPGKGQRYDLRPLIEAINYTPAEEGHHILTMRLRCGSQGAGRPEEVLAALELSAERVMICRTQLYWVPQEEPL